ncbi:MAG: triose-phosphate isomerase [Phycisphaeraceae bacterium]|nr:triose-phosphate isomerase [Phycisphaeraceae bacterium]
MRTKLVGGNWKMNTNLGSARELARAAARGVTDSPATVILFPPFPYLLAVGGVLQDSGPGVRLGAQDAYPGADGAFTGEVSLSMLADCAVSVVLVGHSERRHLIQETDALIRAKAHAVLDSGMTCMLCIGETLEQRERGETDAINRRQLESALTGISPDCASRLVVAYEPVWAIGTGRTATPEDAQTAHLGVRGVVASILGSNAAESLSILYGGSVKASNAEALAIMPDIDGFLVGGASLVSAEFLQIVEAVS